MYPKSGDIIRFERTLRVWSVGGIYESDLNMYDIPPIATMFLDPGAMCLVLNVNVHDETPIHTGMIEILLFVEGKLWTANINKRNNEVMKYFEIIESTDAQRRRLGGEI